MMRNKTRVYYLSLRSTAVNVPMDLSVLAVLDLDELAEAT